MTIEPDPHDTQIIAGRLSAYLNAGVQDFAPLAGGWETTVFEFTCRATPPGGLVPAGQRLVLRLYEATALDKSRHESQVIHALCAAGFPVPRPYLFEPDPWPLGAPFLIMARLRGGPLFQTRSFCSALATFSMGFLAFVRAHSALHRLDLQRVADRPAEDAPPTPLLNRMLDRVARRIEQGPLPALANALKWARQRAQRFADAPQSMVHLDYHPRNAVVRGFRLSGIVDWLMADVGDRHLDAATTAMILRTWAMEDPRWMRDNFAGNVLRTIFAALYIPLYHALAGLDFERFRYCQAVAALSRLSTMEMMRVRGPQAEGFRPGAMSEITPIAIGSLRRYLIQKMGGAIAAR